MEKDEVKLSDLLNVAKTKKKFIIAIYLIFAFFAVAFILVSKNDNKFIQANYKLEWEKITEGYYLDKTRFSGIIDMKDSELIKKTIESNNNFSNLKIEDFMNDEIFYIEPIISNITQNKIDSGELSINYTTNRYKYVLNYTRVQLTEDEGIKFIDTLANYFFMKVKEEHAIYTYNIDVNNITEATIDNSYAETFYDYYDIINKISEIKKGLQIKINDNLLQPDDVLNDQLFDLQNKVDNLSDDILSLQNELLVGGYTKNDSIYRGEEIEKYYSRHLSIEEELSYYNELLGLYNGANVPQSVSSEIVNLSNENHRLKNILKYFYNSEEYIENDATDDFILELKECLNMIKQFDKEANDIIKEKNLKGMYLINEQVINQESGNSKFLLAVALLVFGGTVTSIGFVLVVHQFEEHKKKS